MLRDDRTSATGSDNQWDLLCWLLYSHAYRLVHSSVSTFSSKHIFCMKWHHTELQQKKRRKEDVISMDLFRLKPLLLKIWTSQYQLTSIKRTIGDGNYLHGMLSVSCVGTSVSFWVCVSPWEVSIRSLAHWAGPPAPLQHTRGLCSAGIWQGAGCLFWIERSVSLVCVNCG